MSDHHKHQVPHHTLKRYQETAMGCDDYYDPAREERDAKRRETLLKLDELGFHRDDVPENTACCKQCCALVPIGRLGGSFPDGGTYIHAEEHTAWHIRQYSSAMGIGSPFGL